VLSGADTSRVDNRSMENGGQTSRRAAAIRLLAAALAGAIGAFGVPAGAHAAQQQAAAAATAPPAAATSDAKPE
jgi:hypothetical protein